MLKHIEYFLDTEVGGTLACVAVIFFLLFLFDILIYKPFLAFRFIVTAVHPDHADEFRETTDGVMLPEDAATILECHPKYSAELHSLMQHVASLRARAPGWVIFVRFRNL